MGSLIDFVYELILEAFKSKFDICGFEVFSEEYRIVDDDDY